MKSFDVVADDDPAISIQFPVAGTVITVPRFDFIDEDTLDDIQDSIDSIDKDLAAHRQQRMAMLAQFKPFCTDDQYAVVQKLKLGQLTFMMNKWTESSAVPLGEYLLSVESSTENTAKPSKRTSSKLDGGESTSVDD